MANGDKSIRVWIPGSAPRGRRPEDERPELAKAVGAFADAFADDAPESAPPGGLAPVAVEVQLEVESSGSAARGAGRSHELDPDTIFEIEEADGFVHWVHIGDLTEDAGTTRSGEPRGLVLPPPPGAGSTDASRGWGRRIIRALAIKLGAAIARRVLIKKLETKKLAGARPHCPPEIGGDDRDGGLLVAVKATGGFGALPIAEASQRVLLFVHGTFSNFGGSFGALAAKGSTLPLATLSGRYDRVAAFEHPTLTQSPWDNAKALAAQLGRAFPKGATVSMVSHSRGGMVAELIAIASALPAGFAPRSEQDHELAALADALAGVRVERFVRVACPAAGTLLASERLDVWATVLFNGARAAAKWLATSAPGVITAGVKVAVDYAAAVVTAVLKSRSDKDKLPGLEAMMPSSDFVAWLQGMQPSTAPLAVMAGESKPGGGIGHSVATYAAGAFYLEANDWVVHTASMGRGVRRIEGPPLWRHTGSDIDHFSYFRHASGMRWMERVLDGREVGTSRGTRSLGSDLMLATVGADDRPTSRFSRGAHGYYESARRGDHVVIVVPGFMGSALYEVPPGDDQVWIDFASFLRGDGLARLAIDQPLRTREPFFYTYGGLCDALAEHARVIAFGYDWRKGIAEPGGQLAALIAGQLGAVGGRDVRVSLVAHSQGGVVSRHAFEQLSAMDRERVEHMVYLSVPQRGTWKTFQPLSGSGFLAKRVIARLGEAQGRALLARIPTLYELGPTPDLARDATWAQIDAATRSRLDPHAGAVLPSNAAWPGLEAMFAQVPITWAQCAPPEQVGRARWTITGTARRTPDYRIVDDGALAPVRGSLGDGLALDRSARVEGVELLAVRSDHGDVPRDGATIAMVRSIIADGAISHRARARYAADRRRRRASRSAGTEAAVGYYDRDAADGMAWFPTTPNELRRALMGLPVAASHSAAHGEDALHVSVTYGNLRFAKYPVIVGHVEGDRVGGAQQEIDDLLGGSLSRMRSLDPDRYPGGTDTCQVFAGSGLPFGAAVVVGLGRLGETSSSALFRAVEAGLFAIERRASELQHPDDVGEPIGASIVLIGHDASVEGRLSTSVSAIIEGALSVNAKLRGRSDARPFGEIELVEIYETRAAEALRALRAREDDRFDLSPNLRIANGGISSAPRRSSGSDWNVLSVRASTDAEWNNGAPDWIAQFIGDSARVRDDYSCIGDPWLVALGAPSGGGEPAADIGHTLFHSLVGPHLKQLVGSSDTLLLKLDSAAATLPWELMEPTPPTQGKTKPWGVRCQLMRTFDAPNLERIDAQRATGRRALVIGEPELGSLTHWLPLVGAQAEAEAAAAALGANEFVVDSAINQPATHNLNLFLTSRARVLHVACHGSDGRDANSGGILLGEIDGAEAFLTPGMIRSMAYVPDVVFVNCCQTGRTGSREGEEGDRWSPPSAKLATSVAEQFIALGVRCVIAAAWDVQDDVAARFAEVFYGRFLAGATFGEAVGAARDAAWSRDPSSNTWAAYQVYGDPEFRVVYAESTRALSDRHPKHGEVLTASEAVEAFSDITRNAEYCISVSGSGPVEHAWRPRVEALIAQAKSLYADGIPSGFATRLDVAGAAAESLKQLLAWDEAHALLSAIADRDVDDNAGCWAAERITTVARRAKESDAPVARGSLGTLKNLRVRLAARELMGSARTATYPADPRGGARALYNAVLAARPEGLPLARMEALLDDPVVSTRYLAAPSAEGDAEEADPTAVRPATVDGQIARASVDDLAWAGTAFLRLARAAATWPGGNPPWGPAKEPRIDATLRALRAAQTWFAGAADRTRVEPVTPRLHVYPRTTELLLAWLVALLEAAKGASSGVLEAVDGAAAGALAELGQLEIKRTRDEEAVDRSVWVRLDIEEFAVLRAWMTGTLSSELDRIARRHRAVCALGITPRTVDSMTDRWRLYIALLDLAMEATADADAQRRFADERRVFAALHDEFRPPVPR